MVSLPLVYTILALVAYTASFWYLFIHLMSKRAPNQWFVSLTALLGLSLHAAGFVWRYAHPAGHQL